MKSWSQTPAVLIGVLVLLGILAVVMAGGGMVSPWFYVIGSILLAIAGFLGSMPRWPKNNAGGDTVV